MKNSSLAFLEYISFNNVYFGQEIKLIFLYRSKEIDSQGSSMKNVCLVV